MVFYEGEYHLFYQHYPEGTTWGPMHWGHAVSRDMVHWEHLEVALAPDGNGFIFSGCVVVDWTDSSGLFNGGTGLVAVFTQHDTDPDNGQPRQRQSIAYSLDKGRSWIKYPGNPVLTEQIADFRDPKVFRHEETASWVMVLAAGDHVRLYRSTDLISWSFASIFGAEEGSHDGVWECPDLFELSVEGYLSKKWVLIVSIGDDPDYPEGSRTQYFVGSFNGYSFVNDNVPDCVLWLDHGRDNYAGVTFSDVPAEDGRRLLIGWMSNWKYANQTPTENWRGAMTIPRVLSLRNEAEGIRLVQRPALELQRLRSGKRHWNNILIAAEHSHAIEITDNRAEVVALFEPGDADQVCIKLGTAGHGQTIIGYDAGNQTLFIDRSASGIIDFHPQFACRHEMKLQPDKGLIRLHLFIDCSSVEVFAGDGNGVMTDLIFPDAGCGTVELFAANGHAKLVSLEVFNLHSIYEGMGQMAATNGTIG
ncbi:glycoside hydrolase family 32 protein [Paenibacillus sp. sptzw28]|nr:glycoside hydrolase family 32 protein [Paenibacillus sp. sptzw28]